MKFLPIAALLSLTTIAHADPIFVNGLNPDAIALSPGEENREIRGAAEMVSFPPISIWPRETMPDKPSYLTKTFFTVGISLFCAIMMWFGAPAVMIGLDQKSVPLIFVGILAVVAQSAAILYALDLWFL